MRMRLSRLHHPVTTLGPGRRAGIWFQGCTIRCPGCMSVDTWPRRPERNVTVTSVLDWLASPFRARFSPWERTCTSARERILSFPGSSTRT